MTSEQKFWVWLVGIIAVCVTVVVVVDMLACHGKC